jgi:hypothetical protein
MPNKHSIIARARKATRKNNRGSKVLSKETIEAIKCLLPEQSKKRTRPPIEIPHLQDAIETFLCEDEIERAFRRLAKQPPRKPLPKADADRVIQILKDDYGVSVPDNKQKTIQRRIADARNAFVPRLSLAAK